MPLDRPQTDRRTVLGTAGTGLAFALAGCLGGDSDDTDNESAADGDDKTPDDGTDPNTSDGEPSQLAEPVAFPAEASCAVCGMTPADHPEWNAQLVHADETRTYFCSSGCLLAYTVDPGRFDGPDSEIAHAWATEHGTETLVDAEAASFVRVNNADHVDDIMRMNPVPFADRSDAAAFVGEFDEYDESDIIGFEEFDRDLADLYRPQFFDSEQ